MSEEYRKRIGEFLRNYIEITDTEKEWQYSDEKIIYQGIAVLIDNDIFTVEELQREILKEAGVILSDEIIDKCMMNKRVK